MRVQTTFDQFRLVFVIVVVVVVVVVVFLPQYRRFVSPQHFHLRDDE